MIPKFSITYWETEEDREMGESNNFVVADGTNEDSKEQMISLARRIFLRQDFSAVEVMDDENMDVVFHISTDVPDGETY